MNAGIAISSVVNLKLPACTADVSNTRELLTLPLEILLQIVVLLQPGEFEIFVSTCRAMTDLVSQNRRSVYSQIYNASQARTGITHTIYSPVWKAAVEHVTPTSYPLLRVLNIDAVYDWRVQYLQDAKFHLKRIGNFKECMGCSKVFHHSLLETVQEWRIRLCKLCLLTSVVIKKSVSIYGVADRDIGSLNPISLSTSEQYPKDRKAIFYSAFDLRAICMQKHGSSRMQIAPYAVEQLASKERRYLVATACLLQGGTDHYSCFPNPNHFDHNHFYEEFVYYITGKRYKQQSAQGDIENMVHQKLSKSIWKLTKRPITEILESYQSAVRDHILISRDNEDEVPAFLPAITASPALPSLRSIQAYQRIEEVAGECNIVVGSSRLKNWAFTKSIGLIQDYILWPSEEKLNAIAAGFNDIFFEKRSRVITPWRILPDINEIDELQILVRAKLGEIEAERKKQVLIRLNQIGIILGNRGMEELGEGERRFHKSVGSLDEVDVKEILSSGESYRNSIEHWGRPSFRTETSIGLLSLVYESTWSGRRKQLFNAAGKVASDSKSNVESFSTHLLQFGNNYVKAVNCRAGNLRNRSRIPFELIEEEHKAIVTLFTTGIVSLAVLTAVLEYIGGCRHSDELSENPCTDGCFLNGIFMRERSNYGAG